MAKINLERLLEDCLSCGIPGLAYIPKAVVIKALKNQGLGYMNGRIVEIEGNDGGISPNFKIEKGKWYLCIQSSICFAEGKLYKSSKDRFLVKEGGKEVEVSHVISHFRPATEEEFSGTRERVLKEILDADTIYQMAMNDEMVQEAKEKAVKALSKLAIGKILLCAHTEETQHKPKFKAGDWITDGDNTLRITEVLPLDYAFQRTDGTTADDSINYVDNHFHLWTIRDAKDGDILTCEGNIHGKPIKETGIVKQYVGKYGGCDNCFKTYAFFDWDNIFHAGEHMGSKSIHPATKDRRDLLFSKMLDAGFEWDAEKKELSRTPQTYDDIIKKGGHDQSRPLILEPPYDFGKLHKEANCKIKVCGRVFDMLASKSIGGVIYYGIEAKPGIMRWVKNVEFVEDNSPTLSNSSNTGKEDEQTFRLHLKDCLLNYSLIPEGLTLDSFIDIWQGVLIRMARKQIASEIDPIELFRKRVDNPQTQKESIFTYRQGVEDVLTKIKEG